ncbi:MAG TPA: hypothetical protein VFC07_04685, partial [Verrucomicrobiae bacterium]|nr:hypothetical protein [Verrucomicrobiae bacterium]
MNTQAKTSAVLLALCGAFLGLVAAFLFDAPGRPVREESIALVDTNFLDPSTVRMAYADLV